jgi:hypothetical protein
MREGPDVNVRFSPDKLVPLESRGGHLGGQVRNLTFVSIGQCEMAALNKRVSLLS